MAAIGDMVSDEVRDRLDHLPHAILRLAALRLAPAERVILYEDLWLPDLAYYLKGDEARPVTHLIDGTMYALGILLSARRSARCFQGSRASASQSKAERSVASQEAARHAVRMMNFCMAGGFLAIPMSGLLTRPTIGEAVWAGLGIALLCVLGIRARRALKRTGELRRCPA
jgi:hypothetical protein